MFVVNNVKSKSVSWFRNADLLNHDVSRGGVSIKTDMTADHAKSILHVAWVTRKDGGTYLCSAPPQNASITVHVLNGKCISACCILIENALATKRNVDFVGTAQSTSAYFLT